ncbi:MAG: hypothetical protein KDA37_11845 [Planctomycetales bacterium]|nr:hypothetical protein [Planctomycetales bacterium]
MVRKAAPQELYRLAGSYDRLRQKLLDSADENVLARPLSYWVLPADRRLPIAFLDLSIEDLLAQEIDQLMATQGVGQKKILGLLDLLNRVAESAEEQIAGHLVESHHASPADADAFDPALVSESMWSSYCDTVNLSGLAHVKLGYLAPSLQTLPTVVWHTPLDAYSRLMLAQVRRLKTHGEKRVQAIVEVFRTVHEALSTAVLHENLDLTLSPRFIPPMVAWLSGSLASPTPPCSDAVRRHVIEPLLTQIEVDLGPQVAALAGGRLRHDPHAPTVKKQAVSLGVTRARVYQLLDECADAMEVRWPEGRWLLTPLSERRDMDSSARDLVNLALNLCYPAERLAARRSGSPPPAHATRQHATAG